MDEFLRQAREFEQSVWGGLFYFLGGVFFATLPFWPTPRWRLGLSLLDLIVAVSWNVVLFLEGRWILGGLLIPIILVSVAHTLIVEVRKRKQRA